MKKLLVLGAAAILSLFSVAAQESVPHFSITAGANISSLQLAYDSTTNIDSRAMLGFNVGLGYTFPIGQLFALETGVRIGQFGGTNAYDNVRHDKYDVYYVSVPTLVGYRIELGRGHVLTPQAGLSWHYGIGGKRYLWGLFDDIMVSEEDPWTREIFEDEYDSLHRFDVGAVVGANITHGHMILSVGCNYGLRNIAVPADRLHARNRSIYITLGGLF